MSALARRDREADDARRRALLATRDSVIAAVARRMTHAGSLAIEEAVDTALEQLLDKDAHRCELAHARNWWISWAQMRLIDKQRLAAYKHRDAVPADEHPHVLTQPAQDDPYELEALDDDVVSVRLQEIVASLKGPQRQWADALFTQLLDDDGERELHDVLGWSPAKAKKTGQRARDTMTAFVTDRAAGKICSRRQAVLDAYITATEGLGAAQPGDPDRREFQAVALHLVGCPECQVAWRRRRSTLLERCGAIIIAGPLDGLSAGAHALAGKLAGVWTGAQQATLSLLQRLGIVGAGGAAAGGSAITLTGKTAAVCAGLLCVATAGGELTGVLPPILPTTPHHARVDAARKAAKAPATATRSTSTPARAAVPPPPPPPAPGTVAKSSARSSTTHTTPARTRSTPPPPASTQRVTPGDLPLASNTRAPAPTRPPSSSGSAASSPSKPKCTPGDLGC